MLAFYFAPSMAQVVGLTPQHQITMLEYAGPKVKPIVPIAVFANKNPVSEDAARWLASQHQQGLASFSLQRQAANYAGNVDSLPGLFANAIIQKNSLFFDEADALFGKTALTAEEQRYASVFLQQCKKFSHVVIVRCSSEPAWFALAKGGFGIVNLD